jgi:uncharacterized protein YjbI with pentapeptide repeats
MTAMSRCDAPTAARSRVLDRIACDLGEQAQRLRRAIDARGAADPGVQLAAVALRGALQRLDRVAVLLTVGPHCEVCPGAARGIAAERALLAETVRPLLEQVAAAATEPAATAPSPLAIARWAARVSTRDPFAFLRDRDGAVDLAGRLLTGRTATAALAPAIAAGALPAPIDVAAVIATLDLRERDLDGARLAGAQLIDLDASGALLDGADLTAACLLRLTLCAASLAGARGARAVASGCTLDQACLAGSHWPGATFLRCSFVGASLERVAAEGALFIECDLRGADLGARDEGAPGLRGARFERCDLRRSRWDGRALTGACFTDCKTYGLAGPPRSFDGLAIVRPDLSPAGDGSVIGSRADVIARWGAPARARHTTQPIRPLRPGAA